MNATIVDLRYHMKDVLRAIDRGETVTVLYRGKEKARLTPIGVEARVKVEDQPFFGLWKDRDDLSDPGAYVRTLRQPRKSAEVTGSRKSR
jgi:antitoxin (DNA-binding transcriptional repressor) of toxin-antitoxin stability system